MSDRDERLDAESGRTEGAAERKSVSYPGGRDFAGENVFNTEDRQTADRRGAGLAGTPQSDEADRGDERRPESGERLGLDDPTD